MGELPANFDYEYRVNRPYGDVWQHVWLIHGPLGSVHFHFSHNPEHEAKYGPSAGLEIHYRTPPPYMKDRAPQHPQCQILHAPCWHDGTSLYATEKLYPLVDMRKPLEFFSWLVLEMDRFTEENPDA
jgi:hypothetical protein